MICVKPGTMNFVPGAFMFWQLMIILKNYLKS